MKYIILFLLIVVNYSCSSQSSKNYNIHNNLYNLIDETGNLDSDLGKSIKNRTCLVNGEYKIIPINSHCTGDSNIWNCNNGYKKLGDYCMEDSKCIYNGKEYIVPDNANCVPYDNNNAWICNKGYKEVGNHCIKDCNIKGNISFNSGEKIYHLPGCEYYNATEINTKYGERWFCTEQEAINAGWRKAYNCY